MCVSTVEPSLSTAARCARHGSGLRESTLRPSSSSTMAASAKRPKPLEYNARICIARCAHSAWAGIAAGAGERFRRLVPHVAATLIVLSASQAAAQDFRNSIEIPDPDGVRVHIGPLGVNPSVALSNFGVDTNVFNEPDAAQPKKDLTFSLTPRADLSLRLGPSWLSGKVKEDLVWYRTYSSERGVNGTYDVGWILPLS